MNYYPFHIGDYLSATRHLSWEEDAAYRRLLDTYYTSEKALPADLRAVCRLVLATTESQREAVRVVLEEFFELGEDGWHNSRADAEIAEMQVKQQKQRDKANKRWQSQKLERGNASAMPQHQKTDATALKADADAMPPTPTPTPTPIDKNSSSSMPASKSPSKPRGSKRVPADFLVTDEMEAWAVSHVPLVDWRRETEKFQDWEFKSARTDWPAAWRSWMRKANDDAELRGGTGVSRSNAFAGCI